MLLTPFHLTSTNWSPHSSYSFFLLPLSLSRRLGRLWIWMEAAAEGRGIGHGPHQHLSLSFIHIHTDTNEHTPHFCEYARVSWCPFPPAWLHVCAWICSDVTIQYFVCIWNHVTLIYYRTDLALNPFPLLFWYFSVFTEEMQKQIESHEMNLWKTINNLV